MTTRPRKSFDRLDVLELVAAVAHHCGKADRQKEEMPATVSLASARLELTFSANTLHETFGIRHPEDLTWERLRTIKRQHLSLFLPVLSDDPVMFAVEAERFARGGVYALDLCQRAVVTQASTRTATGKQGKLVAWTQINARTGEAIDRLARRWGGFRAP